jgi:hypothetical protein
VFTEALLKVAAEATVIDLPLSLLQRYALRAGMVFLGGALLVTGLKYYEQQTYITTRANVTGIAIRCEAGYPSGRKQTFPTVVDCADVARLKARQPGADWVVTHVTLVHLAYRIEGGRTMTATARLKLRLAQAASLKWSTSPANRPRPSVGPSAAST